MILARQLSKRYQSPHGRSRNIRALETEAICGLDFDITAGSTTAVFGRNGSGKSTLLSLLAGQIDHYQGILKIQGTAAPAHTIQHPVGYASDDAVFPAHLTTAQLLAFIGKLHGLDAPAVAEKTASINELGIGELLNAPFATLSKGMKQRVNLAQSLITWSDFIVWDEPTNGLDWHYIEKIKELLHRLKREGKTVVFSSHDLSLIHQVADHILHLDQGSVRYNGTLGSWATAIMQDTNANEATLIQRLSLLKPVHIKDKKESDA